MVAKVRKLVEADFNSRDTVMLARGLLGKYLIIRSEDGELSHVITEVEAYDGPEDLACHASKGRTLRTEPLLGLQAAGTSTCAMEFMRCSTWSLVRLIIRRRS